MDSQEHACMLFYCLFSPRNTTPEQPPVMTRCQLNIAPTRTQSYSIHSSTRVKHEDSVFGYICVFGGVGAE